MTTALPPQQFMKFEVRDNVAWIMFNRPEAFNAINYLLARLAAGACYRGGKWRGGRCWPEFCGLLRLGHCRRHGKVHQRLH
jgi:hypothetical protein